MKLYQYLILQNTMIVRNFIANIIGVNIVDIVCMYSITPLPDEMLVFVKGLDRWFEPIAFLLVATIILLYEMPIRKHLKQLRLKQSIPPDKAITASRRLLNEPFFLISINVAIWLIASLIYTSIFAAKGFGPITAGRIFSQSMMVGLITSIISFFLAEHALQKRLAPHFFPGGGLYNVPGTLRIRIRTRLIALFAACNLIPCAVFLVVVFRTYALDAEPVQLLDLLRKTIWMNSLIFIATGLLITFLVGKNLTRPLEEIIQVLKQIRNGRLNRRVQVTTNDEIGYTGDVINEMAEGLKERDQLRQSLALAREIQQKLLPGKLPDIEGLDIAGRSYYCDQTGGDYFDVLEWRSNGHKQARVIVGDVSGHGIPSALLMTTARALLRYQVVQSEEIGRAVRHVNEELTRDVDDSGQFMTLFLLSLDPHLGTLKWVRAGHDPAIIYDPESDAFEELRGPGIALGVDGEWSYAVQEKSNLKSGQVIVIGTDGIWEAAKSSGEMFGKKRLHECIRQYHTQSAATIIDTVSEELTQFQEGAPPADDVTLVVVRMT